MKSNPFLHLVQENYLFPEITKKKELFLKENPSASLISLGIGDTTEPLSPFVAQKMEKFAQDLGTNEGYTGYGPALGIETLREKISEKIYNKIVSADEIVLSDGAKSDLGRLQFLLPQGAKVAIQDPAYPVYVDTSVMTGKSLIYLPCSPENDFFPDLEDAKDADVIIFCSPNNPTGQAATKQQLETLVRFCQKNQILLIMDAAYAAYIQDPEIPKSIYEIEGAKEVAIEVGSFSKMAGFTGIRLGWTVVPKELKFEGGHSVKKAWERIASTFFNGPSNLAQIGGLAALEEANFPIKLYMENARKLKEAISALGYPTYGGSNAPYLWVKFEGKKSWDIFDHLMQKFHLVTTPGSGFGKAGEGFVRFSAFAKPENIQASIARLNGSALVTT
ncbi:MAG: LL-diaminopimelate aminotransferase [Waddliaceae bacterium]